MSESNILYVSEGALIAEEGELLVEGGGIIVPRATPTYKKRAKYNYVITDIAGTPIIGDFEAPNYFKIDQFYAEVFIADETFILYDAFGVAKVVEIATVLPITNNQLYVNVTEKRLGFFATSLTGECEEKASNFFNVANHLQDDSGIDLLDDLGIELSDNEGGA